MTYVVHVVLEFEDDLDRVKEVAETLRGDVSDAMGGNVFASVEKASYVVTDMDGKLYLNRDGKTWTSGDGPGWTTARFDERDQAQIAADAANGASPKVTLAYLSTSFS